MKTHLRGCDGRFVFSRPIAPASLQHRLQAWFEHLEPRQFLTGTIFYDNTHTIAGPHIRHSLDAPVGASATGHVAGTVTPNGTALLASLDENFGALMTIDAFMLKLMEPSSPSGPTRQEINPPGELFGDPTIIPVADNKALAVFGSYIAPSESFFGSFITDTTGPTAPIKFFTNSPNIYTDIVAADANAKGVLFVFSQYDSAKGASNTRVMLRGNSATLPLTSQTVFDPAATFSFNTVSDAALNAGNQAVLGFDTDNSKIPSVLSFFDASTFTPSKTVAAFLDTSGPEPTLVLDSLGFTFSGGINVATIDPGDGLAPIYVHQVSTLPNGNFATLFGAQSYSPANDGIVPPSSDDFFFQIFSPDGTPVGDFTPFHNRVDDPATQASFPRIAVNPFTGESVVTWTEMGQTPGPDPQTVVGFAATVFSSTGVVTTPPDFFGTTPATPAQISSGRLQVLPMGFDGRNLIVGSTPRLSDGIGANSVPDFSTVALLNIASVIPTPSPLVTVTGSDGTIADGSILTPGGDFGHSSYKGSTPLIKSFTVTNSGTAPLNLSSLTVPSGFKIDNPLSATLAPGASDIFSISMLTSTPGTFSGDVTFKTNVPDLATFDFGIAGTVNLHKAAGGTFTFTSSTKIADRTFIDENGNTVVFSLTGPGIGSVQQNKDGSFEALFLDGTNTAKSNLGITVTKGKESPTDSTSIGFIDGIGGLQSFTAPKVNLYGDMTFNSPIKTLSLGNVGGDDQISINIGGSSADKTAFNFGSLINVDITTPANVTAFKFLNWADTDGNDDFFHAFSLGSLAATGKKGTTTSSPIPGDLFADILLTQSTFDKSAPAISQFSVNGDFDGILNLGVHKLTNATIGDDFFGALNSSTGIGTVKVNGDLAESTIQTNGPIGGLTVKGNVSDTTIRSENKIGSVSFGEGATRVELSSNGDIKSLSIGGVTLLTIVESNDKVGSATFGASVSDTKIHGQDGVGAVKARGGLTNTDISSGGGILSVEAAQLTNTTISGNTLGGVYAKSYAATKVHPAFSGGFQGGGIFLEGKGLASTITVLKNVSVSGNLSGAEIDVNGKAGAIGVGGGIFSTDIQINGDLASVTSKLSIENTTISGNSIGSVTAMEWQDGGSINANSKIGAITTKGRAGTASSSPVPGNFTADVHVGGIGLKTGTLALGNSTIAGNLTGAEWSVNGKTGSITVGGGSGTDIDATGDITSFTSKGQLSSFDLRSHGNIGGITSLNWSGGVILADKILSITTKGLAATKTASAIPGFFCANVTITGENVSSRQNALGSVRVEDSLLGAIFQVNGNSGAFTVGSSSSSTIFLGVDSGVSISNLPNDKTQFTNPGFTLAGFTVTGKGISSPDSNSSFNNTRIAAGILTNASLRIVNTSESNTTGIAVATKIVKYTRRTGPGPTNVIKVDNKTAPDIYDPTGSPGTSGFRLQIVPLID